MKLKVAPSATATSSSLSISMRVARNTQSGSHSGPPSRRQVLYRAWWRTECLSSRKSIRSASPWAPFFSRSNLGSVKKPLNASTSSSSGGPFVDVAFAIDADMTIAPGHVVGRGVLQLVGADHSVAPSYFRSALNRCFHVHAPRKALTRQESGQVLAHGPGNPFFQLAAAFEFQRVAVRQFLPPREAVQQAGDHAGHGRQAAVQERRLRLHQRQKGVQSSVEKSGRCEGRRQVWPA